jgi:hypothetical protein
MPVVSDSEKLLCTGDTPKYVEKTGNSGCAQYISENVENPAQNNAQLARRYALVPATKPDDIINIPWSSAHCKIALLRDSMNRLPRTKKPVLTELAFAEYEG